jgi:RNA polymerase-binding protein DksA
MAYYEALKTELEQRLARLQSRLASIKQEVTQSHSGDSAEQAQERENDEVVDAIGNETAQTIREIQSALIRIEDGTYGICGACGEEIGEGRLQAVPEATRCVNCAA